MELEHAPPLRRLDRMIEIDAIDDPDEGDRIRPVALEWAG